MNEERRERRRNNNKKYSINNNNNSKNIENKRKNKERKRGEGRGGKSVKEIINNRENLTGERRIRCTIKTGDWRGKNEGEKEEEGGKIIRTGREERESEEGRKRDMEEEKEGGK